MKYIIFFIAVTSLLIFNCTEISPNQFLAAGFITFLIPIALFVNLIAFILLFYKENYLCLIPLIVLVIGFKYIGATFAINLPQKAAGKPTFSVLSFNTTIFNRRAYKHQRDTVSDEESKSNKMVNWARDNDADIKCFQEFYNLDSSAVFNTVEKIARDGEYDYYFSSNKLQWEGSDMGIAIFSRFPIINSGDIMFKEGSINRAAFADIVIHKDTIRFINVHLESMSLSPYNPLGSKTLGKTKENVKTVYHRLAKGLVDRSFQAEILFDLIHQSPYKVIMAGDLNQTPYSFVYNSFKKFMHNAFERAGNGFGVSYGGKTLFFLRIDNQFYDPGVKAIDYKTHYEMPYSDHYPIEATYTFEKD